jgi:hypothetical protein
MKEPEMTSSDILKIKAIAAMLEASDLDDEEDAKQLIKMIKGLIAPEK